MSAPLAQEMDLSWKLLSFLSYTILPLVYMT
jgi:hypothetical protein